MSVDIPGCTGVFSIFQETSCQKDKSRNKICLSPTLHGYLDDLQWLA